MSAEGWRTCIVQDYDKLSLRDGLLVLSGEEEITVPLNQLRRLLLMSPRASITTALLNELAQQHISVLFCDQKRSPAAELLPIGQHVETAGAILDQSAWTASQKDILWAHIVRMKIHNQQALLTKIVPEQSCLLNPYEEAVLPGDPTNREGQAARLYFSAIFGNGFIRHGVHPLNAPLNYGYTILCSAFSRAIALHGYHTALGIHHCSRANKVNLSSDLMEPFRPFIDFIVWKKRNSPFDWPYKQALINALQSSCYYKNRQMTLDTAVECFTIDSLRALETGHQCLGEVSFERKTGSHHDAVRFADADDGAAEELP